jgi:hypothetical protein
MSLNRERAVELMERFSIDALVAAFDVADYS